jgi:DNA-binding CsgD family transcriptional regulator
MIQVVGPITLQNQLMAMYLEQITQIKCSSAPSLADVDLTGGNGDGKRRMILCDCLGGGIKDCLYDLERQGDRILKDGLVGLFNLRREESVEEESLSSGVRGFFYQGDSIEQIAKGVSAMLDGELWISRKVMARYILNNNRKTFPAAMRSTDLLTVREKEILSLIAKGAKNEEIATRLFISRHTVKTHLYNIFKKINTPNRLQAALWASKNL